MTMKTRMGARIIMTMTFSIMIEIMLITVPNDIDDCTDHEKR